MKNEIASMIEELKRADPVPIPEKYSDLDHMMGEDYKSAHKFLVEDAGPEVFPTWTLLTKRGQVLVICTPFTGEDSKELIAVGMRKLMKEAEVIRYTFMSEAWLAMPTKAEWDAGDRRPPSEREDRVEVVLIAGGDKNGSATLAYEMVRDWTTGHVVELKKVREMQSEAGPRDTMSSGRFIDMLADEA